MKSNTGIYGVYRVVYPEQSSDGYLAKVHRRTGKLFRIFQLSWFKGDHDKCKAAAALAVRLFDQEHPAISRRESAEVPRMKKKDSDLPVGVCRIWKKVKGHEYSFYTAVWSPRKNVYVHRCFSVNKYGDDGARQLAEKTRADGLKSMKD